jgi:hypothetical protein
METSYLYEPFNDVKEFLIFLANHSIAEQEIYYNKIWNTIYSIDSGSQLLVNFPIRNIKTINTGTGRMNIYFLTSTLFLAHTKNIEFNVMAKPMKNSYALSPIFIKTSIHLCLLVLFGDILYIPLLINHEDPIIKHIANWRMKIGI